MREWMSTRMEAGTTMTSLARTERPGHDAANLSPSVAARHACRSGMASTTAGVANGFVQGNLVVLSEKLAASFHRFCQLNPKPCPIIGMSDVGNPRIPSLGLDLDIRTDLPRYRVWRDGEVVEEPTDITAHWRDDLVAFVIGCSYSFEEALLADGRRMRSARCRSPRASPPCMARRFISGIRIRSGSPISASPTTAMRCRSGRTRFRYSGPA